MSESRPARHSRGERWIPILLSALALIDLRVELNLLFDHFTLIGLGYAVRDHLLAAVVLALLPSLWRRYGPWISR